MLASIKGDLSMQTAEKDTREQKIQNTTKTGNAPLKRFATANAVYAEYDKLKDGAVEQAKARAKLKGLIDGNPPYNPAELRRLGQAYRTNVNFREAEAIIDSNVESAWELHMEVNTLIEVDLDPAVKDPQATEDYAAIIAEEYTRLLRSQPSFHANMDLATREAFKYGIGGMTWSDPWDWRSEAFLSGNLIVPAKAPVDIEKLEVFFLRDEITLGDLYRTIEDEEFAKQAGWNVRAVKDLLVKQFYDSEPQDDDEYQLSDWESFQQRIKNNDTTVQTREFDGFRVVHAGCLEPNTGKISHLIIPDDMEEPVFLYEARDRYDSMRQMLWLLPFNYGDKYIRSVKGLGHRIAPHIELSNRFLGSVFDGGQITSSLILQPRTAVDFNRAQLMRLGPVTILPPEMTAVQTSYAPPIAPLISLRQMSKDILLNNTGVYRPHSEANMADMPEKTARQVVSEESKEARFEKNRVQFYYNQWQLWHEETFRRLTNPEYIASDIPFPGKELALDFHRRCILRGVPPQLMLTPGSLTVRVSRAIGLGSLGVKMDLTNQLMQVRGAMDEIGSKNTLREWAAVRVGYTNVDKFFPKINRDKVPVNETSIATLENNDFIEGRTVPVGTDQTHSLHAVTHMTLLNEIASGFIQEPGKYDLMQVYQLFRVSLPHIGEHLQYLSNDTARANVFEELKGPFEGLIKFFKKLEGLAKKQLEQQQKEQAAMAQQMQQAQQVNANQEVQAKLFEIQKKYELEVMKQDSLNKARADKTEIQNEIKRAASEALTELKREKQAVELELDRAKTEAKIEMERRRTEASAS